MALVNKKGQLRVTFDMGLSARVNAWARSAGYEPGRENEATMALVEMALASTPHEGLIAATRAEVYRKIRYWMLTRFHQSVVEIRDDLKREIGNMGAIE